MAQTWTKDSGPGTVTFVDLHDLHSGVSFSTRGVYVLRLTDDGSSTDTMQVTVIDYPKIHAFVGDGPDARCLLSSGYNLTAECDVQSQPTTFQWSKVSGPGDVTFTTPTSLNSHVDFTKNGVYELRITATIGSLSTYDSIIITVLDLEALPSTDPSL